MSDVQNAVHAAVLSRDEAVEVAGLMEWINYEEERPSGRPGRDYVADMIRRLRAELTLRDGAGWWDDQCPTRLHLRAVVHGAPCPDSWTLTAPAVEALRELLPDLLVCRREAVQHDRGRRIGKTLAAQREEVERGEWQLTLLEAVADRLGVVPVSC